MEPVLHFAVPFSLLLLLRRVRLRWAILAGIGGLLPDLDVFFMVHRSVSHSLLLAEIPMVLGIVALRKRTMGIAFIALSLGWVLHAVLDFFSGFTPVLWPLSDKAYSLILDLNFMMSSSPSVSLRTELLEQTYNYGFFESFEAPVFTAEGLTVSLLLLLTALLRRGERRSAAKRPIFPA